jgi:hypothetical protein
MAINDPSMPPSEAPTPTPTPAGMPPGMPPAGPQGGDQMVPVPMSLIVTIRDIIGQLAQGMDQLMGAGPQAAGGDVALAAPEAPVPPQSVAAGSDEEDLANFAQQLSNR